MELDLTLKQRNQDKFAWIWDYAKKQLCFSCILNKLSPSEQDVKLQSTNQEMHPAKWPDLKPVEPSLNLQ